MRQVIGITVALILLTVLAYVSRFWVFSWWERGGLFGIEALRPAGDLWRRWMNGFDLGPYDIVLWAVAAFALLSVIQWIWAKIFTD